MNRFKRIFFTADGGDGKQGGGDTTPPANTTTPPPADDKKFSQADVDGAAAKARKSAEEKFLKELGVADAKTAKDAIAAFQKAQDEQKSEIEKATGRATDAEKRATDAEARAAALEMRFAVVSAGVPAEKADRVAKLAAQYDGETASARVEAVKADFPELFAAQNSAAAAEGGEKKVAAFGSQSKGGGQNREATLLEIARRGAGLI